MFIKNAVTYSSGNIISQTARVIQEFVVRRILAPEVLGVWNFVLVVQSFVATFDAGIVDATSRELPILHGAQNLDAIVQTRSTALWSKLGQNLLLAIGIIIYAAISWRKYNRPFLIALLVSAILVIVSSVSDSFITFHQSAQAYVPLSKVLVLSGVIYAILLSLGALVGGLWGLMIAGIIAVVVQASLMVYSGESNGLNVKRRWDYSVFKRLIGFGVPFRLVDYPGALLPLIDVLVVTKFMGIEALAIYATAKAIFAQATQIPVLMGNVVIMRLFNLSGGNVSRDRLGAELMRFLLAQYLITIPVIICGIVCVMSFLLMNLIPKYSASLPVLQTILFSFYFIPQTSLVRNFWILDKRLLSIGIANVVGLVGMLASYGLLFMLNGMNLGTVALATVSGYAIFFLALMVSVGREVWGGQKSATLVLHVACSLTYVLLVLKIVGARPAALGISRGLGDLAVNLAECAVLLSPMIAYCFWKTAAWQYVKFGRRTASTISK